MKKIVVMVITMILLFSSIVYAGNTMSESYKFYIIDPFPCYLAEHVPAPNEINVVKDTDIAVHVKDDHSGVNITTIKMFINGVQVQPIITGTKKDYLLVYSPSTPFEYGQEVNVRIEANDLL